MAFFFGTNAYHPNQEPHRFIWVRASTLKLSNGASIPSVSDASGNGHTLSQSTSGQRPTFNATSINGRPAISFGLSRYLAATLSPHFTGKGHVCVMVMKITDKSSGAQRFAALINLANGGTDFSGPENSLLLYYFNGDKFNTIKNGVSTDAPAPALNTPIVLASITRAGQAIALAYNGTYVAGNGVSDFTYDADTFFLGKGLGYPGEDWFSSIDVSEVFITSALDSDGQMARISRYFKNIYGTP
jgi:hypothetical protein